MSLSATRRTVVVNGRATETEAATLAELIAQLGFGEAQVATAVNGDFIARRGRQTWTLASGDTIEIVSPRQGG